jgi:hypothetical protein
MAFEDITGVRHLWSDYQGGTLAAASGTVLNALRGVVMQHPYTIIGASWGAGTTPPAGTTMSFKFWVNGAAKGVGVVTLTAGAGARVSSGSGYTFTGPANSHLSVAIASVGGTAGVGGRLDLRYVHGHMR